MNSASAVAGCSRSIRQLIRMTRPSVPRNSTSTAGPLKIICPNGVSASRPAVSVTAALKVIQDTMPVSATPMAI